MNKNQLKILLYFIEETDPENCYYYSSIQEHTGIELGQLKKEMAELRKIGLVECIHGLFNEDGETAGSGHQIIYGKRDEVRKILEENNAFELKIKIRIMEMLNKIAPGKDLVIPVIGRGDKFSRLEKVRFDKVEAIEALFKIAKYELTKI